MAITFKFKFENESEKKDIKDMLHSALVGSPAYINNEICLSEENKRIILIVGNNNKNDIEIEIEI